MPVDRTQIIELGQKFWAAQDQSDTSSWSMAPPVEKRRKRKRTKRKSHRDLHREGSPLTTALIVGAAIACAGLICNRLFRSRRGPFKGKGYKLSDGGGSTQSALAPTQELPTDGGSTAGATSHQGARPTAASSSARSPKAIRSRADTQKDKDARAAAAAAAEQRNQRPANRHTAAQSGGIGGAASDRKTAELRSGWLNWPETGSFHTAFHVSADESTSM